MVLSPLHIDNTLTWKVGYVEPFVKRLTLKISATFCHISFKLCLKNWYESGKTSEQWKYPETMYDLPVAILELFCGVKIDTVTANIVSKTPSWPTNSHYDSNQII